MKRLSALLIGAFMLVGANSVVAFEGSSAIQLAPSNSAISAVRQNVSDENTKEVCADFPTVDGEGISIERVCVRYDGHNGLKAMGPQFDTPEN